MAKSLDKHRDNSPALRRIQRCLSGENIDLTADEINMLERWEFADRLLREKRLSYDEIRIELVDRFGISKWTAEIDISNTQSVFARARRIDKKYLGHLHLERIDKSIRTFQDSMIDKEGKVKMDEKDALALTKLFDSYTKVLEALPEIKDNILLPPPMLVFNLPKDIDAPKPTSALDKLFKDADEIIEEENDREAD